MRLARYLGGGEVAIIEEVSPTLPPGGLLVRTEACGLCSGELMEWYMDAKIPHVLGHEVSGVVEESDDARFPVGSRVFPHHHAPCMDCAECLKGNYVHCPTWKTTKLAPGGMAEHFAVAKENLQDTIRVDQLRALDAALIEPLACVVKSFRQAGLDLPRAEDGKKVAVIGLGVMGLMHALLAPKSVGYDLNEDRLRWARSQGLDAWSPEDAQKADVIFVLPGSKSALDTAVEMLNPGGRIVLFAPMPPGEETPLDLHRLYFLDATIACSYSCGPDDTRVAVELLESGKVKAEQVVSDFVALEDLPKAYREMKEGSILKAMVIF